MTAVYAIHKMLPELPIIVLTAFGSPDVKAECLRQGAAAFVEKPLDTPQLLTAVEGALESQKSRPANNLAGHEQRKKTTNENIKLVKTT